jgi:antitoxin (DNA-binding transcriptional repressor) of toxin-antitoxin stability system
MAAPAFDPSAESIRSVPLREARNRLTQLVAFAELTDVVTMITRDGETRPVAAIVPAPAARSVAQTRAEDDRLRAVTAGWARRLDALHERSARMHAAELRAVTDALAEVWAQLDRRVPSGADPELTRLRAAHHHLLAAASQPTAPQGTAPQSTAPQPTAPQPTGQAAEPRR